MKATKKIIVGIGFATVVGLIIYMVRRKKASHRINEEHKEVSDHGYETAHDILFPGSKKGRKTIYGPVLPS